MAGKTSVREFQYDKDEFFEIVRAWALSANFEVKEKGDNYRLYHRRGFGSDRGSGWLAAQHDGKIAQLEAWLGSRDEGNGITKGRMSLEKAIMGGLPKAQYRAIFNKLLDLFEEPRM